MENGLQSDGFQKLMAGKAGYGKASLPAGHLMSGSLLARIPLALWQPRRWLLSFLWGGIVLLALIEPKQAHFVFPAFAWFYPADLLMIALTLFYLVSRVRQQQFPQQLYNVYLYFAAFAGAYLLTSTINLCLLSSANTDLMTNGVVRILLQYLIAPPFILCTLSIIYQDRDWESLRSFIVPSLLAIAVFVGAILLVFFANSAGIPSEIKDEILAQGWVPVGSFLLFLPKWGVTYAESQEFGLFIFLSFLLVDIYREHESRVHQRRYRILCLLYFAVIIWTASKGVVTGACIYLLLRNRRHVQIKSAALAVSFGLLACYLGYSVTHDPVAFTETALSHSSFDERAFHALYFIDNAAARPIHLLIGFGARQHGTMISRDYPLAFTENTTPVSMFGVVTDSGLIGLACYLSMMAAIWLSLREYRARLAVVAAFLADLWMPDWSMDAYILFLLIVLFATRRDQTGTRRLERLPSQA
jgi:hypothetical protein